MEEARFDDGGRPVAKPLPPARNQKIFQYPSNIDTISFPQERGGSFFLLFFFQRQREQSLGPTLYYIKRAATFVKISSSSSSVVPLNRASKSSNENYPNHRIRSPKAATKKKRAHKRCPLLDSPRGQTRQTKRGRGGFLHLWRRRAPVVESLLIPPGSPVSIPFYVRRLKLGIWSGGRGPSHTRMLKLYRSRCSISKPSSRPPPINSQILITTFFPSPLLSPLLLLLPLSLQQPSWMAVGWPLFENYLRPLEKWEKERERDENFGWKISLVSGEDLFRISFFQISTDLGQGIDLYRVYEFHKGEERARRDTMSTRIALRIAGKNTF